jgi:hypothetical protein
VPLEEPIVEVDAIKSIAMPLQTKMLQCMIKWQIKSHCCWNLRWLTRGLTIRSRVDDVSGRLQ